MTIPRDAIPLEDFERMEQGLPPRPKKIVVRPEPEMPKIENQINFADIPIEKLLRIQAVKKRIVKNWEGVRFIGYDAIIELREGKPLTGWFQEGTMEQLRRMPVIKENTDARLLGSIGW